MGFWIYIFMMLITGCTATAVLLDEWDDNNMDTGDKVMASLIGFMFGVIWPVVWIGVVFVRIWDRASSLYK